MTGLTARREMSRRDHRGGFTLLEMVIVLVVLVVVVSLTWPSLMRFAREQQLREWSSEIRRDMAGARVKSIENGMEYQFRYEPGGRYFAVLPSDRPDTGNSTADSKVGKTRIEALHSKGPPATLGQLPLGLHFRYKDGQPTEELPQEWLKMLPSKEPLGRISWSLPLLFHLDGTADNATVYVQNKDGQSQLLTLRGLTGAITIGPIRKEVVR